MPEETQEKTLDDALNEEVKETPPEETPPEEVDWKARAEQAERVAADYKREIETKGLRNKNRIKEEPANTDLNSDQIVLIQNDFLSKKEDVLHELQSDINALGEEEWSKIQPLFKGAINSVFDTAVSQKRFAARGEIVQSLRTLIDFAKKQNDVKVETEKARIEGFKNAQALESAEISGVRTSTRTQPPKIAITDADKEAAEATKEIGLRPLTPEQIATNRERSSKVRADWQELYKK